MKKQVSKRAVLARAERAIEPLKLVKGARGVSLWLVVDPESGEVKSELDWGDIEREYLHPWEAVV